MSNTYKKDTVRFNLANASSRLLSRFFDLIFITLFVIGFLFLIVQKGTVIAGWKIFLFTLIMNIIFFLYFIILPFLWNGYTLFNKAFKIKIYSVLLKNIKSTNYIKNLDKRFLLQLIKRDLFNWIIPTLSILLYGILCISLFFDDATEFIKSIFYQNTNIAQHYIIVSKILATIISFSFMCPLFVMINVILTSRKRSVNDHFSDTVVIKMVEVHSNDPFGATNNKNKKVNMKYSLPGEIVPEAIETIEE